MTKFKVRGGGGTGGQSCCELTTPPVRVATASSTTPGVLALRVSLYLASVPLAAVHRIFTCLHSLAVPRLDSNLVILWALLHLLHVCQRKKQKQNKTLPFVLETNVFRYMVPYSLFSQMDISCGLTSSLMGLRLSSSAKTPHYLLLPKPSPKSLGGGQKPI